MLLLCLSCGRSLIAAPPVRGLPGLRSELWQMEYQRDSGDAKSNDSKSADDAAREPGPDGQTGAVEPTAGSSESDGLESSVEAQATAALPGEPQPDQLTDETPLAEWQLDDATQPTIVPVAVPTDWQISRARGFRNDNAGIAVDGPSAVTFAVAIVAGIVVTGAMFTGRD